MNQLTLAAIVAVVLCVGSATLGYRYAQGQAAREELLIQKAGAAASTEAAKAIAGINVQPIRERIEKIVRELPATPVECNAPPAVVEAINDARKAP